MALTGADSVDPVVAHIACSTFAFLYVAGFYVFRSPDVLKLSRDHPQVIKARIRSVAVASIVILFIVWLIIPKQRQVRATCNLLIRGLDGMYPKFGNDQNIAFLPQFAGYLTSPSNYRHIGPFTADNHPILWTARAARLRTFASVPIRFQFSQRCHPGVYFLDGTTKFCRCK